MAQTTGDQYENVTIPTTKIPPKIQEKTRKNSSNLPPMPVRNQAEVSYATLELNPIENPTHGMFIKWRNTTKKSYQQLILVSIVWQYGLWSCQTGGTKLERFLLKNQHT